MAHILLVEDDRSIVSSLSAFLESEGFRVTAAGRQEQAIALLSQQKFDLLLIDISLPDGNGYAVCAAAKAKGGPPVVFLTASDDEYSIIAGFDMGAADYVSKPFRPRVLLSRIKNVLRRQTSQQNLLKLGDLHLDTTRGAVFKLGRQIHLSALEYRLLLVFLNNQGIVLSRVTLLEEIWDSSGEFVNDNTLTVYIKRLREKIEDDPQNPRYIHTIRGMGYRAGD